MTRQEAIDRLHDEKSRLVNRLGNAETVNDFCRILSEIRHKQDEIRVLETMFCDPEVKS